MHEANLVYITKWNLQGIVENCEIHQSLPLFHERVFLKPIYFLNNTEKRKLLLLKEFLRNAENFLNTIYKPKKKKDSYTYIYEGGKPAFHRTKTCESLHTNFRNFEIPTEIKTRSEKAGGEAKMKETVQRFRDWFSIHKDLLEKNPAIFLKQINSDWNINRELKEIVRRPSGASDLSNYNLDELEGKIIDIISAAADFYNTNPDKQQIIRDFIKKTFLIYSEEPIKSNYTGLTDEELKKFIKEYYERFTKPIKFLLVEYYRIRFNPDLSLSGTLLERLNFIPCQKCFAQDVLNDPT